MTDAPFHSRGQGEFTLQTLGGMGAGAKSEVSSETEEPVGKWPQPATCSFLISADFDGIAEYSELKKSDQLDQWLPWWNARDIRLSFASLP